MAKTVIVFHMTGCSPCQEYLPRFRQIVQQYRGKVDARAVNIARSVRADQDAAIKFKITGTPTTIVIDENEKVLKRKVGGISNKEIQALLEFAAKE